MDTTWIVIEGKDGIASIFDDELNKGKKHKRDDKLIPFTTKTGKNVYEDFSGVVGAFSRILSNINLKKGLDKELLKTTMKSKMSTDCSDKDFEQLFRIVENMYFEDGKLLPVNTKALCYIDSNISQQQVAEYLYSLFIENTGLEEKYSAMTESEDTNVLEKLVFDSLENDKGTGKISIQQADCFLPYVKEVFIKDFEVLTKNTGNYQKNINRFLAYYYMFYVTQLAVKLGRFERGKRDEIEKIYLTLYDEVVTRVRPGYEYGWKYVKEKISHMFSHSVLLELLSHNIEHSHVDYIGLYEKFRNTEEDEKVAEEIEWIRKSYQEWIVMDYSGCKHDYDKDSDCMVSNEVKKLFDVIDYQFLNGGRKSHYNGYNKKFSEFVQKNFGKFRGVNGYTLSLHDSDIIMFTQIILEENEGRIRLAKMFDEFELRGLLFDRDSRKRITELYEKMNLLEKRSDSGDAQYVKYIL
ncbi:MAG: DNA phosphorothioation-dependent restriction protein DptG [Lachnospiraceae bacterium]|nr:DNA phosphorothioation-dependent restriction protein DptG [Lachnospiraceae bacterium]